MFQIKALSVEDIDRIRKIHSCYFKDQFEFPDFLNNFLCAFIVTDDNGEIITAGGVRLIAESVIVTDMNRTVKERRSALYQVLDASEFITRKADFPRLHAVTEKEDWKKHLEKVGFRSRGNILALDL